MTKKKQDQQHNEVYSHRGRKPDYHVTLRGVTTAQWLNVSIDCYDVLVDGRFQCCAQIPYSTPPELVRQSVIRRACEIMPALKHVPVKNIELRLFSSLKPTQKNICTEKATAHRLKTERMQTDLTKKIHNVKKLDLQ